MSLVFSPSSSGSSCFSPPRASPKVNSVTETGSPTKSNDIQGIFMRCMSPAAIVELSHDGKARLTPIRVYDLCDSPFLNRLLAQPQSPMDADGHKWASYLEQIQEPLINAFISEFLEAECDLTEVNPSILVTIRDSQETIYDVDLSPYFETESEESHIIECINTLVEHFPDITTFVFKNHPTSSTEALKAIAQWEKIEVLDLSGSIKLYTDAPEIIESAFPNLRELNLNDYFNYLIEKTDVSLSKPKINDSNIAQICTKVTLKDLDITGSAITSDSVTSLSNLNQLIKLNLSYCTGLNKDPLYFVTNMSLLKEINLEGVEISEEALLNLGKCKKLKKIHLSLEGFKKTSERHSEFSLNRALVNFITEHPLIEICVNDEDKELFESLKNYMKTSALRVSQEPKNCANLKLPDL